MAAANTGSGVTHFSNVAIGTSGGNGTLTLNGVASNLGAYESVTAGKTLVAGDNGMTIILGDAAPGDITLPAVTNTGFTVKIVNGFAITSNSVVTSAEGDNITGVLTVNGALVAAAAEDFINFIANTALIGDWVELTSTGTAWAVHGQGSASGSITATDPS